MEQKTGWLLIILGIVLLLPLMGINQLGSATNGLLGWVVAIVILLIGIIRLTGPKPTKKKK